MVRALRAKRAPRIKKTEQYDENDPAAYKDMTVPDKKSAQYSKDIIDEFHDEKIAMLMARGVKMDSDQDDIDDEEEVMALDLSDSEDHEEDEEEDEEDDGEETDMDSDLEGKKDDDLPNEMAWGSRKKMFYDSDYVATKGKKAEEVVTEDQEEEEEAKKIQKRLAANLSEEDYDLSLFQEFEVEEKAADTDTKKEERIVKDLKDMSQKEKIKLLKKESPELLELIQDFKTKLLELKDEVQPLLGMVKDGLIPPGKGADYLKTKQQLYLNYCTNISFYLVLKARRIPAHNHPVIERLLSYRNLINEMSLMDARLAPQLHVLLNAEKNAETTKKPGTNRQTDAANRKAKASMQEEASESEESDSDLDEQAALQFYKSVEARLKLKRKSKSKSKDPDAEEGLEEGLDEEVATDSKRGITYQMAKNKGLTPKRKKIDRNPRVKHREKFRRAKIRRKGQVREVRREETRYSGELSGIRAGVKKSVKLK